MDSLRSVANKWLDAAKRADRRVLIVAGAVTAGALALFTAKQVLKARDGEKYLNDDQKALCKKQRVKVAEGVEVDVEPITTRSSSYRTAAECLAASHVEDPMIKACGAEVGGQTVPACVPVQHRPCVHVVSALELLPYESALPAAPPSLLLLLPAAFALLQSFKPEKREASLRWLYGVLLRASAPSSTGSIPLQTAGSKAVAVWWSQGTELSLLQVALHGGWKYVWRYSGWDRRGRFPGYSEVISSVRARLMASHENAFFYLLTYARRPELSEAEAKQQLAAVVLPVTKRVRRSC